MPPSSPGYLPDALQTLLLGGIWWFVLIWLPLLQSENPAHAFSAIAPLLFRVEGLVSALISLVVIGLRIVGGIQHWRETGLLLGIAVCGVAMVVWVTWMTHADAPVPDALVYLAALQGILALACFLARRQHDSVA